MFLIHSLINQVAEVPVEDVLQSIVALIGGVKGASILGISALVIQVLMKVASSKLANFAGKYKLVIVLGLSLAGAAVNHFVSGGSLPSLFMNAGLLSAAQVFGFEVYSQFFKKA